MSTYIPVNADEWVKMVQATKVAAELMVENKRLRKAGDAMYRYVGKQAEHSLQVDKHNKSKSDWIAAKEGKEIK